MTVKELIEELGKHDSKMRVFIRDSEYGFEEIGGILTIQKDERIWEGSNHHTEDVLEIN